MKKYKHLSSGFTLIELIVVIAIISLLSAVILTSLGQAKASARDGIRKTDLKQLQTVLELYYTKYHSYPISDAGGTNWNSSNPKDNGVGVTYVGAEYIPTTVSEGFIFALPVDPLGAGAEPTISGCYESPGPYYSAFLYKSDGENYKILSHCNLEGGLSENTQDAFYDPYPREHAFMVCSAEPACSNW